MKKTLKVLGITLAAILILLIVLVIFVGGAVVKNAVNTVGPTVLGVPVTLADADFRPLRGKIGLDGLIIGNPESYKSDHSIKVETFRIDMVPGSLMGDTIQIREILIDGADIMYEMSLRGSNLGAIMDGLAAEGDKPEDVSSEADEDGAKSVQIDRIIIRNGKIRVSSKLLQGKGISLPLPTIELTDIGKEDEKASVADVVREVFSAVLGAVTGVVKGSGKLIGSGVGAAADMGGKAVGASTEAVGAAAGKTVEVVGSGAAAVGGAAAATAGAIGDGAGAVGKGAVAAGAKVGDGTVAVGKAIGSGAGKLVGGIGGLLKRGEDEDAQPDAAAEEGSTD